MNGPGLPPSESYTLVLCCWPFLLRLLVLDKFIEDGTVVDHCGAEFFSACVGPPGPHRDGVRQTVVFHHTWVSYGDVSGTLLKAGTRIAAGFKDRINKVFGFCDRGLGMIDEAGLNQVPLRDKAVPLRCPEISDFQGFHSGFPVSQFRFSLARGARLGALSFVPN